MYVPRGSSLKTVVGTVAYLVCCGSNPWRPFTRSLRDLASRGQRASCVSRNLCSRAQYSTYRTLSRGTVLRGHSALECGVEEEIQNIIPQPRSPLSALIGRGCRVPREQVVASKMSV
jgi:hypothetical protein